MSQSVKQSFAELCDLGAELLRRVIAIESQSDALSETIPSTEGQRKLSEYLAGYFTELGFSTTSDASANLLATVPGNIAGEAPKVAFMVHIDTAEGTRAIPELNTLPAWDGGRIPYPENERLEVSVARYPETRVFLGQDLLFGPGQRAMGLDDKLGMAEMMLLAHILATNPDLPRPDMVLVGRPDEEIGRMAAVEGLADEFARRGVTHGYTVDGLDPFEINTENFYAAGAEVRFVGRPLALAEAAVARVVTLLVEGAKSHGATAKAEGYFNATMAFVQAFPGLDPFARPGESSESAGSIPVGFETDATAETSATLRFLLRADSEAQLDSAQADLIGRFDKVLAPHGYKGAQVSLVSRESVPADRPVTDELIQLHAHLCAFVASGRSAGESGELSGQSGEVPEPLLSEHSDGYQGYSNPHFVRPTGEPGRIELSYRLRDFTVENLSLRKKHVQRLADSAGLAVEIADQYINMGPGLAAYPELVEWAERAARAALVDVKRAPIRGGTGVDPFLARNIPIANLGTGYFAPESEKEFTSRQVLARTALWLTQLVQVIATAGD